MIQASACYPDWVVIRVCYGLMGALLKWSDLPVFASYLLKHASRRPPDHLLVEWYASETVESLAYVKNRTHLTFKYNLLAHIGSVSSLRGGIMPSFAGCYDFLEAPVMFPVRPLACRLVCRL
jgi:hypothetical protein